MSGGTRNAAALAAELLAVRDDWRVDAACNGAGVGGSVVEFVDVGADAASDLIRAWCWRCPVVGSCRALGDSLAPHPWPSVYGARYYDKAEPVDGWPECEIA